MWEPGVLQDTLALEDFLRPVVCGGSSGRPGRGRLSRGWDERTQGREEGREGSRALSFLALQGPGWARRDVPTRDCSPTLLDSSLALRASPGSDIWVFRACTYLPLAVPVKIDRG